MFIPPIVWMFIPPIVHIGWARLKPIARAWLHVLFRRHRQDDATVALRIAECRACEHYRHGRCRKCGCFMRLKARLTYAVCPVGKWPATERIAGCCGGQSNGMERPPAIGSAAAVYPAART